MKIKNRFQFWVLIIVSFLLLNKNVFALDIKTHVTIEKFTQTANDTILLVLDCDIPEHYHLYSNPLGPGIGKPIEFTISDSKNINWISAKKSKPKKFNPDMGDWVWAYEKNAKFFFVGVLNNDNVDDIKGTLSVDGLMCANSCIPITQKIPFNYKVEDLKEKNVNTHILTLYKTSENMVFGNSGKNIENDNNLVVSNNFDTTNSMEWDYQPVEKKMKFNFFLALIFAFLAGVILNVMPCVLPVLGIKVLAFSQSSSESRSVAVVRSLFFAGGMIVVFMLLATLAVFANFSWGEQFQKPGMLVGIVVMIFIFGLGMFDVYTIIVPSSIGSMGAKGNKKGFGGEIIKGMMTTVLATPCSGPFLGATLAWTLTQPASVVYIIFLFLGLGMAFPYVILSASKNISSIIPKPGPWMDDFKHIMGFFLIGFAIYLMIGLPSDMFISTLGMCLVLSASIFLYGRISPFGSTLRRKLIAGLLVIGLIIGGWYGTFVLFYNSVSHSVSSDSDSSELWKEFSKDLLVNAHATGQHVIVDFTANWCMNCQFNKINVLHSKEVTELIKKKNILALKGDITQSNPPVESLLHHLGSRSVPFLAIFPGDDPYSPIIMRDILNKKEVIRVLNGLAEK